MPTQADDPLRKVTLNLYAADCEWLATTYGRGWTERIRQHIHHEVIQRQRQEDIATYIRPRRTLGDL